jgi:sucrose-6-phosphate hydrolase SacC (GH32 family)
VTAEPTTAELPVPLSPTVDAATVDTAPTPWWRPRIHATPARAWMNDPNGLVWHGGTYHLYFQYHPDGVVWGPMSWGHLTSPDLLNWTEQPVAIRATGTEWAFSGCIVIDDDGSTAPARAAARDWSRSSPPCTR